MYSQIVELQGHIIDSLTLTKVLDQILEGQGSYEVLQLEVGHSKTEPSYARILVRAQRPEDLAAILDRIRTQGALTLKLS